MAHGFVQNIAGYRINRILHETKSECGDEFIRRSPEYRLVAQFPSAGRATYLMNRESATALAGSLANVLFRYDEPQLMLRESDQQLLFAALNGATDSELADSAEHYTRRRESTLALCLCPYRRSHARPCRGGCR